MRVLVFLGLRYPFFVTGISSLALTQFHSADPIYCGVFDAAHRSGPIFCNAHTRPVYTHALVSNTTEGG